MNLTAAGRTDAGVHARCQVIHFDTGAVRTPYALRQGGNSRLPRGVAILWAQAVDPAFHARYAARATLPLHHSQTIVWENDERCQMEYFMHPTNDFIMEIMKYGETVKVEEPTELKENIKNRIMEMVKIYEN